VQHGCPEFIEPERLITINNTLTPNASGEQPAANELNKG